ncbi:MAG: hypothetical protein QNJ98_03070 [Planctomycetota bacterium]|nr:hypothetical protein [Planctomycetota bacterium]
MRARWLPTSALVIGLGLLAACGEPANTPSPELEPLIERLQALWTTDEEVERSEVIEKIGALARKNPDAVVPVLVERLRTERVDPRFGFIEIDIDYSDSKLDREAQKEDARALSDVILARLGQHPEGRHTQADFKSVAKDGIARIRLRVLRDTTDPEASDQALKLLLDVVTRPGRLDLVPVVERPGNESEGGTTLWKEDAAAYDAYLAKHRAALEAAAATGDFTPQGDGPFRVVGRPTARGDGIADAVIIHRPVDRAERFTHEDVTVAGKRDPKSGQLILELAVKPERREALDAFCARHQGQPLAVLVDYRLEFTLPMPKDADALRYTAVGLRSDPGANAVLQRIVSAIRPGALTRPVIGRLGSTTPQGLRTPLAAALIGSGPVAKQALEALLGGDDALARRARWIRREIDRIEREREEQR